MAIPPFPWPDPNQNPRILLYADQTIGEYMSKYPEWFANDSVIAGLYIKDVPYGQSSDAIHKFNGFRNSFIYKHVYVGTVISGTTALHEFSLSTYPANAVSIEDMSTHTHFLGPWLREPSHQVVDLSDANSRHALQGAIKALWAHVPTPLRFVDNAAVHPKVARMQSWDVYCQNMSELRNAAGIKQSHVIFNVFVRLWEVSDKEMNQLMDAVGGGNGISLPLPWSKSIKDDKNASGWALYRYRQLLDHGIAVILIPSDDAPKGDMMKWVATWRRPTDPVYIAIPYWEEPIW